MICCQGIITKDYIPITRVNEWITGFGSGSNAFILIHGFVNCQSLKLTANRGDIANTDPLVLEELKTAVKKLIDKVDDELNDKGIYTLREWQEENRTLQQEKAEFNRRVKKLDNRKVAQLDDHLIIEPYNEAELFGLFTTVYALKPTLFDFEPYDYNASRGIDIIARSKRGSLHEGDHRYIELKHTLQPKRFNHAFQYLRWIICWDFDKRVGEGCELQGIEDNDIRRLQVAKDDYGHTIYFLDCKNRPEKVQVIRLKEFLKERLNIEFIQSRATI